MLAVVVGEEAIARVCASGGSPSDPTRPTLNAISREEVGMMVEAGAS